MTPRASVGQVLAETKAMLLDFDGPVCSIFAGLPATVVAAQLREGLSDRGVNPPDELRLQDDPLAILRWTATHHTDLVRRVDDALRNAELTAVHTARPTRHSLQVIRLAGQVGVPLAIVSNNSEPAISAYLDAHGLTEHVQAIVGRAPAEPWRMKPNPEPLLLALTMLNQDPRTAAIVGDSTTDIQAAHRAGVRSIGYANKPGKRERLLQAGADAVVDGPNGMFELSTALQRMFPK